MKIRAAVAREGNPHPKFENVELDGPRADEVLVRMVATGVCHTDLKAASVFAFVPKPVVLGHEGAGIVRAGGLVRHQGRARRPCGAVLLLLRSLPELPRRAAGLLP